jgi:hypothetical protein
MDKLTPTVFEVLAQQYRDWCSSAFGVEHGLPVADDALASAKVAVVDIAIGLRVPVLVILGATCHQEIELYGRGAKIISDFECSPCYLSVCPKEKTCMQAIPARTVYNAAAQWLRR